MKKSRIRDFPPEVVVETGKARPIATLGGTMTTIMGRGGIEQ